MRADLLMELVAEMLADVMVVRGVTVGMLAGVMAGLAEMPLVVADAMAAHAEVETVQLLVAMQDAEMQAADADAMLARVADAMAREAVVFAVARAVVVSEMGVALEVHRLIHVRRVLGRDVVGETEHWPMITGQCSLGIAYRSSNIGH